MAQGARCRIPHCCSTPALWFCQAAALERQADQRLRAHAATGPVQLLLPHPGVAMKQTSAADPASCANGVGWIGAWHPPVETTRRNTVPHCNTVPHRTSPTTATPRASRMRAAARTSPCVSNSAGRCMMSTIKPRQQSWARKLKLDVCFMCEMAARDRQLLVGSKPLRCTSASRRASL